MKKYKWTLNKALEFITSRKPNVAIRPNFINQLVQLENKFLRQGGGPKTDNWNKISETHLGLGSEELLVTNTFLNAKNVPHADYFNELGGAEHKQSKIGWLDEKPKPNPLGQTGLSMVLTQKKKPDGALNKTTAIRDEPKEPQYVKSILKGSNKVFVIEDPKDNIREAKLTRNNSADTRNVKSSSVGPGRKGAAVLRPGSSMISNGRSQILKSHANITAQDTQMPSINGNTVQPTVNNFMFTSATNFNTTAPTKEEIKAHRDKKGGFSLSASNKDLVTILNKTNPLTTSATFSKDAFNSHKDDGPMLYKSPTQGTYVVKDHFARPISSSLGIFGSGNAQSEPNTNRINPNEERSGLPIAFKIEGARNQGEKPMIFSTTNAPNRFAAQNKPIPIRVISDNTDKSKSVGGASRPITAPNNILKSSTSASSLYGNTRQPTRNAEDGNKERVRIVSRSNDKKEERIITFKQGARNPSPIDPKSKTSESFTAGMLNNSRKIKL